MLLFLLCWTKISKGVWRANPSDLQERFSGFAGFLIPFRRWCSLRCLLHMWMWCCPLLFSREKTQWCALSCSLANCLASSFYGRVWALGCFYRLYQVDISSGFSGQRGSAKLNIIASGQFLSWCFLSLQLPFFQGKEATTQEPELPSPPGTGMRKLERSFFAYKPHHVVLSTGGGEITSWI